MTAKIIELDRATIEDAAKVLRAIADEIDSGKHVEVIASVVILDGDQMAIFGSGDASQYKCLWMLEAAKKELLP